MSTCPKCNAPINKFKLFIRPGNYDHTCKRCDYKMQVIKSPNATMIAILAVLFTAAFFLSTFILDGKFELIFQAISIFLSLSILFYVNVKNTEIL